VAEVCAEALVAPAAVELVAVGVGPGPYTSLRAGIMFARTTGFAVAAPVVGACSLDVVARKLCGEASLASDVVIATDARRREVYWARYTADGRRLVGPRVGTPDAVQAEHVDAMWIGPDQAQPDAATLAQWAAFDAAAGQARPVADDRAWDDARADGAAAGVIAQTLLAPHPLYLRRPDVHLPSRAT
jgi:tRNA threonylcarbamoyl adenosine modification protein YeaZ